MHWCIIIVRNCHGEYCGSQRLCNSRGLRCLFGMVCTSATIPGNIWEEFDNMEGLDVGEG